MLMQFPKAHEDELLGSLLARFIWRQGITDEKVALELLFGSRMVVPSALLQGHVSQLLDHVGHIWHIKPRCLIESHTALPLFRPFIGQQNYKRLIHDLSGAKNNHSMLRSGVNASALIWPTRFKICPICWQTQRYNYGYSYWQRLFQSPGVDCCPEHFCSLMEIDVPLQSEHRHKFVGSHEVGLKVTSIIPVAQGPRTRLAELVNELLNSDMKMPEVEQWSTYYRMLADRKGFLKGKGANHQEIARVVTGYWGKPWLEKHGLGLETENNWLVMMFRKHRRPFTYLHHFVCWLSMDLDTRSVSEVLKEVVRLPGSMAAARQYCSSVSANRCHEYRNGWLRMLKQYSTLKSIRKDKEGARLYLWLYRYDYDWLQNNHPPRLMTQRYSKVDWHARDLQIVRRLLAIERTTWFELTGPRRSKSWYCRQIGKRALLEKKLKSLPLCKAFFVRYSESVAEYQVRRLACIMARLIEQGQQGIPIYEIERRAGLSKERCLEPARQIIRYDVPTWQSFETSAVRHTIAGG